MDAKGEIAQRVFCAQRINWVKHADNTPYLLNLLPLNPPRMKCYGVYVIWYFDKFDGPITIRTGIKSPKDHLIMMRNCSMVKKYADHTLYITWAESKSKDLVGIWTYLCKKLKPREAPRYQSRPISVNLPPWIWIPDVIPDQFDYEACWWRQHSKWYRRVKEWRCEECNISLYKNRNYLDTHHTKGPQSNEPEYLKALCVGCHAEQPGEGHLSLKEKQRYQNFMRDYGAKWERLKKL